MRRLKFVGALVAAALAAGVAAPAKDGSASDRALQEALLPKKKVKPPRDGDLVGRVSRRQRVNPRRQARRRLADTYYGITGTHLTGRQWVRVRKHLRREGML